MRSPAALSLCICLGLLHGATAVSTTTGLRVSCQVVIGSRPSSIPKAPQAPPRFPPPPLPPGPPPKPPSPRGADPTRRVPPPLPYDADDSEASAPQLSEEEEVVPPTVETARIVCSSLDDSSAANVTVFVGEALYNYLWPMKWTATRGVTLVRGRSFTTDGRVSVPPPPPPNRDIGDWGVTFVNLTHLNLDESSITDLPLSPVAPLLQCLNCSRVSATGLTLAGLVGGSGLPVLRADSSGQCPAPDAPWAELAGQRVPAYGAMHVTGASAVQLDSFTCMDVTEAHGFACARLELVGADAAGAPPPAEPGAEAASGADATTDTTTAAVFSCSSCVVERNRVSWGAPELLEDHRAASVAVSGSSAVGRGALVLSRDGVGGGEDAGVAVDVELRDCSFDDNRGGAGAALSTEAGVQVGAITLFNTILTNNVAELGSGGALLLEGGVGSLALRGGSSVRLNFAAGLGGAVAVGAAFAPGFSLPAAASVSAAVDGAGGVQQLAVAEGSVLDSNLAVLGGGAVFVNGRVGSMTVSGTGSSVSRNRADWGSGGAVLVAGGMGSLLLSGGGGGGGGDSGGAEGGTAAACTLCYNKAYDSGGAIHVAGSSGDSSSTLPGMHVEVRDGARLVGNSAANGAGGALSLTGSVATVLIEGAGTALLSNMAATTGGAVVVRQGGVSGAITLAEGAVVANCNARKGGAIKVDGDVGSLVVAGGARLESNNATRGPGGGALVDGKLTLLHLMSGGSISRNYAFLRGGGVYVGGGLGAAVVEGGAVLDSNTAQFAGGGLGVDVCLGSLGVHGAGSSVSRNVASLDSGGGVWARGDVGELVVSAGARLEGNFALDSGGALYVSGGVGAGGGYCGGSATPGGASGIGGGVWLLDGGAVDGNRVTRSRGAGLAVRGDVSSMALERGGSISNNTAGDVAPPLSRGAGGHMPMAAGVWVGGVVGWIRISDGSRISHNIARKGGAAMYIGNPDGASDRSSGHVGWLHLMNGSCICDNLSGTIPDDGSRHAVVFISGRAKSIWVQNSSISRNQVLYGDSVSPPYGTTHGGALLTWQGVGSFVATDGSDLSDNAGGDGAVLCVPDQPPAAYHTISGSGSGSGSGLNSGDGYAIGEFVLEASRMERNNARGSGGALWTMGRVGELLISAGSSVSGNRAAGGGGGAIYLGLHLLSNVTVMDSVAAANAAAHGGGFLFHQVNATGAAEVAARLPPPSSRNDISAPSSPFVLSLIRSNITDNVAVKDGGAFLFDLNVSVPVLDASSSQPADAAAAAAALVSWPGGPPLLQLRVEDSELSGNWARIGAGGAVALLNALPVAAATNRSSSGASGSVAATSPPADGSSSASKQQQQQQQARWLADVSLGFELLISGGSRLLRNRAGDDSVRFEQDVDDVSPLAGNGGALFLWAQPSVIMLSTSTTSGSQSSSNASAAAGADACDLSSTATAAASQQQQWAAAGRDSQEGGVAWPGGSRACRLYIDGAALEGNRAAGGYGGGAAVVNCAVAVRRSRFAGNAAALRGGGLAFADYGLPAEAVGVSDDPHGRCGGTDANGVNGGSGASASGRRRLLQQQQPQQPQQRRLWLDVSGSAFDSNSAVDGGGGLFVEANATSAVRLADCSLTGNSVPRQGGGALIVVAATAAAASPATAAVEDATAAALAPAAVAVLRVNCSDNEAGEAGGCLALRLAAPGAAVAVQALRAAGNAAGSGAGVSVAGVRGSAVAAEDCVFDSNTARTTGGGWATGASFLDAAAALSAATAAGAGGAATAVTMVVQLSGCSFSANRALLNGGGVAIVADPAVASSLRGCNFTDNTASSSGGGLAVDGSALPGGSVVVAGCSFSSNGAKVSGGAVHVLAPAGGSGSNGSGAASGSSSSCGGLLQILGGSKLTGNWAGSMGGALMIEAAAAAATGDSSALALPASSPSNDSATPAASPAGAATGLATCLLQPAAFSLQNASVSLNSAPLGGAIFVAAGATALVNSSRLVRNSAAISGGAVAAVGCRALRLTGCDVLGGDAKLSGGGVFVDSCGLTVVDRTTLFNNTASAGGGIHLSGLRGSGSSSSSGSSSNSNSNGISSNNGSGSSSSSSSSSAALPVALLHKLNLTSNRASGVFGDVSVLAVNYPSYAGFQPYGSHGGAVLISNVVGVAISGSDVALSNKAEVGSAIASTQRCTSGNGTTTSNGFDGGGLAAALAAAAAAVAAQQQEQQAAAEGGLVPEATWRAALGELRRALTARCALLTIANTHLPMGNQSSAQAERGVVVPPLPAVWLEDLTASSLEARCSLLSLNGSSSTGGSSSSSSGSGSGSSSSSGDDGGISSIADMVQQALAAPVGTAVAVAANGVPPPAAAAFAAVTDSGSSNSSSGRLGARTSLTLATLLQMLHGCVRSGGAPAGSVGSGSSSTLLEDAGGADAGSSNNTASSGGSSSGSSDAGSSASAKVAIAVSATHLRVASVTDALLLANISGRVQPAYQQILIADRTTGQSQQQLQRASATDPALSSGAPGEPSDGSSSSSSGSSSTAVAGAALATLLVSPGGRFGLRLQLHDGLGQPNAVDIPKYDIRLDLIHLDNTSTAAGSRPTAVLRGAEYPVTTSYGVAAWDELLVYGWPGRYVLRARADFALDTVGPRAYPIAPLLIPLTVAPCEVGQELVSMDAAAASGSSRGGSDSPDSLTPLLTWCKQCRRDQLGLWHDRRPDLPSPLPASSNDSANDAAASNATTAAALLEALGGAANATRDLLGAGGGGDACDACCVPCPDGATCAGGALVIPQPGFWHSAANSTAVHACINAAACGDGWDESEPWSEALEAALAAVKDTAPDTLVWSQGRPALALARAALEDIVEDARSRLLGSCQQWWYHNLPPQQSRAWAAAGYAPLLTAHGTVLLASGSANGTADGGADAGSGSPPLPPPWCQLYTGGGDPTSYLQLQCAEGYTGNLCATCQPGYTLSPDFDCSPCPSLARTITLGILAFLGTVFLILYTTFTNMSEHYTEIASRMAREIKAMNDKKARKKAKKAAIKQVADNKDNPMDEQVQDQEEAEMKHFDDGEEDYSASDVLKAIITHAQFYIIVTKLGIAYPQVVTKYQAAVSAFTGAENYMAYSPTCLTPDSGPGGQASTAVAMGLLTPCVATALAALLWALRRFFFIQKHHWPAQTVAQVADGGACGDAKPAADGPIPASRGASQHAAISRSATQGRDASSGDTDPGPHTPSVGDGTPAAVAGPSDALAGAPSYVAAPVDVNSPAGKQLLGHSYATAIVTSRTNTPNATPRIPSGSSTPTRLRVVHHSVHPADTPSRLGSANANGGSNAALQAAAAAAALQEPRAPSSSSSSMQRNAAAGPVAESQEDGVDNPAAPAAAAAAAVAVAVDATCAAPSQIALLMDPTAASTCGSGRQQPAADPDAAPQPHPPPTASSPGPYPKSSRNANSISGGGGGGAAAAVGWEAWRARASAWLQSKQDHLRHPLRGLAYADTEVKMGGQLCVLVIVASFILYPSLAQVSLSIFACYTIDTGAGTFPENQMAIWSDGWWLRNMNQRCYEGEHLTLYLPIGVVAVLVFCVAPPLAYFIITAYYARRGELQEKQVLLRFGFLYHQYRRGWHWWGSARQLQTLAMVVVEVFGSAVSTLSQSLMLLAVLILFSVVNMACPAERSKALRMIEFLSTSVLCLTITLSLYFVQIPDDQQLSDSAMAAVGIVIVVINVALIFGFVVVMFKSAPSMPKSVRKRWKKLCKWLADKLCCCCKPDSQASSTHPPTITTSV